METFSFTTLSLFLTKIHSSQFVHRFFTTFYVKITVVTTNINVIYIKERTGCIRIMGKDERTSEEVEGKKPFIVKRLWQWFRSVDWLEPINRWKLLFVSVVAFFGIASLAFGVVYGTSTTTFCSSCHEMAPEYVSHVSTAHSESKCTKCHIEPGVTNTIIGKIMAMKEVYHHVTRTQPDPIYLHSTVNDVVCLQCHSDNRDVTPTGDLVINHGEHIAEGIPCVACHAGVAHAKAVERGLNRDDSFDYWTKENAHLLVTSNYVRTNMGTCLDCHEKVNQGERPWEIDEYMVSVPPNKLPEDYERTLSNDVLKTMAHQNGSGEISMECAACHTNEDIPNNHTKKNWNVAHGKDAVEDLERCLSCHEEEKWVKRVQQQSVEDVIYRTGPYMEFYVPDIYVVASESRNTSFCFTCHSDRPDGHKTSDEWLTGHAKFAETKEEQRECFVCHDQQKEEKLTAPTDVYCEFCHRTGLK